jgi:predicted SAM-dependent methyltransferase
MSSYLEHEVEMTRVLEGVFRTLKSGGQAFIRVPNYGSLNRRVMGRKWCGFRYPDHVNYFTLASLRKVAAKAGFDTKLVNRANLWVDDNIQALLVKP